MSLLKYEDVREKERVFQAMTSLTVEEFDEFTDAFEAAWEESLLERGKDERNRGRKAVLGTTEQRLFFILFYLKTYPLQEVQGHLFGLSQGPANEWIHRLSGVLQKALARQGHRPARLTQEMLERLEDEGAQRLGIDGTDRRHQRPKDEERQKQLYSGKRKTHTVKNNLIGGLEDRQIKYLGQTHEGRKHDKKMADEEKTTLPEGSDLYRDVGFQGHAIAKTTIHQPTKKPRGGQLTDEQKEDNRLISRVRVIIEHIIAGVKRCHIVKAVFRNTKEGYDDQVMELACGLHNLRSHSRMTSY